jgi:hypothetical protein
VDRRAVDGGARRPAGRRGGDRQPVPVRGTCGRASAGSRRPGAWGRRHDDQRCAAVRSGGSSGSWRVAFGRMPRGLDRHRVVSGHGALLICRIARRTDSAVPRMAASYLADARQREIAWQVAAAHLHATTRWPAVGAIGTGPTRRSCRRRLKTGSGPVCVTAGAAE